VRSSAASTAATAGEVDERDLIDRLRGGDEGAFAMLVERHHAAMVRLARGYVRSGAVAEEVAQEAWLGLLRGVDGFEGRSSLRTWLFRIVINRAISTGVRESQHDNGRFGQDGWWVNPPLHWADEAVDRLVAPELAALARSAIDRLPAGQRQVVTLRDVEGLSSMDVCAVLGITEGNQRVLLHRGRARVRAALEREMRP
jgi:RNA polymerase sigma-70 factor, ECF subfamily